MDSANTIRSAIAQVFVLRARASEDPRLGRAVVAIKRLQARRFCGSYIDLLQSLSYGDASRFFLEELYGERDYSDRDNQFARIAGSISTVLPSSFVEAAVALAELHLLTEDLDHQMATQFLELSQKPLMTDATRYVQAWRSVGCRSERQKQLIGVLQIGQHLVLLTRKPGLSAVLKLMRRPAAAAGLASLQQFLETGFEIFRTMARSEGNAKIFLGTIQRRESAWIGDMFDAPAEEQANALAKLVIENQLILGD